MYRYYVPRRAPLAFWMLDSAIPFLDHSGASATGNKKSGTSDPTKSVPLVSGADYSSVFKSSSVGKFACNVFKQGLEQRPFVLEAWVLPIPKSTTGPQQILSHDGQYDGLSINGKVIRFGTQYANFGDAFCSFDLGEYQLVHVVGIHSSDKNELFVNGNKVAEVKLTEDQQGDTYITTDDFLYSGFTSSTQELAMNGVAFYASLSGDQINQNYLAGIDFIGQAKVSSQIGGESFNLNVAQGSIFATETWATSVDFNRGRKTNVEIGPEAVVPSYVSGISQAGSWMTGMPLDGAGDTSIYGVILSWTGSDIVVEVSLDGGTWTAAVDGELLSIIPNGYNPTNKDLWIRASFAGGLADDPAYLESITAIGFRDNKIANSSDRAITATHPAVLRNDYETNLYRDDNGISLHGGTLTIGPDTTTDPDVARTLELWIKPISGTSTISVGGTKYRNGVPDSTLPVGEWSLIHYVAGANITGDITISGNCIVGQASIYPVPLTADDVAFLFDSYTGSYKVRYSDTTSIGIPLNTQSAEIYAHDWAIDAAG